MKTAKIKSITKVSPQRYVYDLCCSEPHSYVSNGFISHNCVAIIDEAEKAFTTQHDSGVTSGLLGSLLWWMQEHTSPVFTVLTTNNKDIIPRELYREGRIDEIMLFKGLENIKDATEFTNQVAANLISKLEIKDEVGEAIYKQILIKLQLLFSMGKAIPQVVLIKEVNTIVKQVLTTN